MICEHGVCEKWRNGCAGNMAGCGRTAEQDGNGNEVALAGSLDDRNRGGISFPARDSTMNYYRIDRVFEKKEREARNGCERGM